MDKVKQALLEALKQAVAEPGEQRLYRSGKLPGLFFGRTAVNAEAAALAFAEGLLELVRTETKGKIPVEWVRITPKGLDYVVQQESPVRALDELRTVLQVTQEGIPVWLAQLQQQVQAMGQRLAEEVQHIARHVDRLSQRVSEVLHKVAPPPPLPEGTASAIPWAQLALDYLDRRRENGVDDPCPLPELFGVLHQSLAELTVKDFHAGLRRLHDRAAVRLLPFEGTGELPEPEYALLDGTTVYYFAAR